MKTISLFAFALLCAQVVRAQNQPLPQALAFKDAIAIALVNNPDLQARSLKVGTAEKEAAAAKWDKIPDIYGNYDLQRNLVIRTTPVPARAFDPTAPEGAIRALRFSTDYTSDLGLDAQWDLFNPRKHGKEKAADKQVAISRMDQEIAENNLRYTVGKDYAACIIAQEQVELAIADSSNKAELLKAATARDRAGRAGTDQLNRLRADRNAAGSKLRHARMILETTKSQLAVDMGYPPDRHRGFTLSDSLGTLLHMLDAEQMANPESLSLRKSRRQNELTQLKLRSARQGYLPTLTLNGFYGADFYADQLDLLKGENWYGNSYVNLALRMPLSEGIARSKRIEKLRLRTEADKARMRSERNALLLAKKRAKLNLDYSRAELESKKKDMGLAQQNYRIAEDRFNAGRMLAGDLSDSSLLYEKAKADYLQAAYDRIVAVLNARKVMKQ